MGTSILYHMAALGVTDAVLLEQSALASGATGRSQGILRMHYSNEVTTRMAWESLKVFKAFDETVGGPSGYVPTGYLLIVSGKDRRALERNVAMQRRAGVRTDIVAPDSLSGVAPMLSFTPDELCAFEPDSGYADPYSVTQGYARRARDMGARILTSAPVTRIETADGRVTGVVTREGKVSTGTAVVAAGPWSRELLGRLGVEVPLETIRHQVIMLHRPVDGVPDHPSFGDVVNGMSARPDVGGITLIGAGDEERAGLDTYNRGLDLPVVEDVSKRLAGRMPGMTRAEYRGGWSGLFTTTPDWHPILDRVDGINGLYLAVGFSGHGFKLSPMVGMTMSELIVHGRATTIDISPLRLNRFKEGDLLMSRYGMSVLA